jgi:tRNA-specific 2-thiouridylase
MLYALSQTQLKRTIFPLGSLTKQAVREIARQSNIPAAHTPDSQDVCYATRGHAQFVRDFTGGKGLRPGTIRSDTGETLGQHEGIYQFTLGQRKGLGVALGDRVYVSHLDGNTQTVTLSPQEKLYRRAMRVHTVQWSAFDKPPAELKAEVKIRYQSNVANATVRTVSHHEVEVNFKEPQLAITPGQRAVFYEGDVVLGGGIIGAIISDT